jgi:hypothetical protein
MWQVTQKQVTSYGHRVVIGVCLTVIDLVAQSQSPNFR